LEEKRTPPTDGADQATIFCVVKSLLFLQGVCEAGRDASGAFGNKIGKSRIASPDLVKRALQDDGWWLYKKRVNGLKRSRYFLNLGHVNQFAQGLIDGLLVREILSHVR
jgi:hypothetical protein